MSKKILPLKKHYSLRQEDKGRKVRAIKHAAKRAARHPYVAVPFVTVSVLMLLSVIVILIVGGGKPHLRSSDTHVAIINYDKQTHTLPTREKTVGDILHRAEVPMRDGDVVEPGLDTEVVSDNFRINVYRAVPVTIVDNGKKTFVFSAAKTPRSIVKQAGIEVYPEDRLDMLPVDNFLVEGSIGERVVVRRATAVNLNLYGTQLTLRTQAETVGQLLAEKNIKLEPGDTLQPSAETRLKTNDQVFVLRGGVVIETAEEEIPMPREVVEDASLSFGTQVVRQQGTTGRMLVTYEVNPVTGERRKIQEVPVVEAVPHIVARGKAVQIPSDKQAVMAAAGIAPSDYAYVDFIMSHESGWCPTKVQGQYGSCPPYAPETIPTNRGYGLGQATPGSKMSSFGADWKTNPVTQLKWAVSYVNGRYKSWQAAYDHWQAKRWW